MSEQKDKAISTLTGAASGLAIGVLGVMCVVGKPTSIFALMLIVFTGLLSAILGAVVGTQLS